MRLHEQVVSFRPCCPQLRLTFSIKRWTHFDLYPSLRVRTHYNCTRSAQITDYQDLLQRTQSPWKDFLMRVASLMLKDTTRLCGNSTRSCLLQSFAHSRVLYRNCFWLGHTAMSPFDTVVSLWYRILAYYLALWSGFRIFIIFLVF